MSKVPTELLDIVQRLRELTEAGRIHWSESGATRMFGGRTVEVSLASGQWTMEWSRLHDKLGVLVRDDTGERIYNFTVTNDDPHFKDIKAAYDAAAGQKLEKARTTALSKMREELATR